MLRINPYVLALVAVVLWRLPSVQAATAAASSSLNDLALEDVFARATQINQVDEFTRHQTFVQRALAISSSTTSIVFCLCSMYMFFAIDPRRLVFRHQLIFFLLFFDLLKAFILLLYPTRVLTTYTSYFDTNFCHVVGFFTATAIEGADFAILTFAIHTYLLIFKPSLNVRVGNSRRVEGGLYRYRFYIYGTSFLVPLVLASLTFVDDQGYVSFVCWCYLPQRPVWYRMVLSWVPRYVIIATIFTCYSLIYYHVIKQIRTLGGVFTTAKNKRDITNEKPSFYSALKYFFNSVIDNLVPKFIIPESSKFSRTNNNANNNNEKEIKLDKTESNIGPKQSIPGHNRKSSNGIRPHSSVHSPGGEDLEFEYEDDDGDDEETMSNDREGGRRMRRIRRRSFHSDIASSSSSSSSSEDEDEVDDDEYNQTRPWHGGQDDEEQGDGSIHRENSLGNTNRPVHHETDIHLENLKHFRRRQRVIKKQMKSIFIYPVAYIFLWLFPFILYITQLDYEHERGPIYWLNCMGAFMQPFNGFVDSLVFFYRETPWKYTVMKKFEKDHADKMDTVLTQHGREHSRSHSHYDSSVSTAGGGLAPPKPAAQRSRSQSMVGTFPHHLPHPPVLTGSAAYMQGGQPYGPDSLSANLGVDIIRFKRWRRFLNDIHLPFFELPTEGNLVKLQKKYLNKKMVQRRETEIAIANKKYAGHLGDLGIASAATQTGGYTTPANKHDYSNVLGGGFSENEFRSNLESFSLNFQSDGRHDSQTSADSIGNPKVSSNNPRAYLGSKSALAPRRNSAASQSNRSFRSRQYSVVDPNQQVIIEGKQYDSSPTGGSPSSPTNIKQGHYNTNSLNSGNTLAVRRGNSGSSSPNKKLSKSTIETRNSTTSQNLEDEMDFLEFLRKGPPT